MILPLDNSQYFNFQYQYIVGQEQYQYQLWIQKIEMWILEIRWIRIRALIKCWIISSSFWFWSTRDRSQNGTSFSFVMLQTEFINFCISRNEIRFLDIGLWVYFFYRSDLFRRFSNTKFKFANCAIGMADFRLYCEKIQKMKF